MESELRVSLVSNSIQGDIVQASWNLNLEFLWFQTVLGEISRHHLMESELRVSLVSNSTRGDITPASYGI